MSQINTIANSLTNNQSSGNAIKDLDVDSFLKLMIAELQNQDPLNPMENDQMLAQIGQMREIAASDKLSQTLDSVLLGQNIASATNLIGAEIDALSDDNQRVTGKVLSIAIADGIPKLHLTESSGASVSNKPGEIQSGEYQYRIVWEEDGTLFGVQTDKPIAVTQNNKSIAFGNLPETKSAKQIYRTKAGTDGPYFLVGTLIDGKTAGFLDTTADDELSATALNRTPLWVEGTGRSYVVSLKNVGEIRPPATPTTTPDPNATNNNGDPTDTTNEPTEST